MVPGPWYMFSKGVWDELVSGDCFSGEVRKVVEFLKTETPPTPAPARSPWKPVQTGSRSASVPPSSRRGKVLASTTA